MKKQNKLLQKYKRIYKGIGAISCPAFNNEKVYFNNNGINHLLRKGSRLRNPKEQFRRLRLLKYCKEIINNPNVKIEKRLVKTETNNIQFWGLKMVVDDKNIVLVLRQKGNGRKHFYSIFNRK